jgi:hypothetical protein
MRGRPEAMRYLEGVDRGKARPRIPRGYTVYRTPPTRVFHGLHNITLTIVHQIYQITPIL